MSLLRWDEKYSVGVPTLDAQHRNLFRMINAMQEAMLRGRAREVHDEILAELREAAELHFAREEALLRAARYPGLVAHRREHRAFLEEFERMLRERMGGTSSSALELMDFLGRWWHNHLLKEDLDYRQWLLPR